MLSPLPVNFDFREYTAIQSLFFAIVSPPYDSVSLSHKGAQVFFHILILNALYHLAFPTVEDEFPCDGAIAVLCLGAFFSRPPDDDTAVAALSPGCHRAIKLSAVARTPAALPYNVM